MNVQEKPPEFNPNPCAACTDEQPVHRAERSPTPATSSQSLADIESSALLSIETENTGLRRLIVDLIRENQQLRERMSAMKDGRPLQAGIASQAL